MKVAKDKILLEYARLCKDRRVPAVGKSACLGG